jgi:hypothetical protein
MDATAEHFKRFAELFKGYNRSYGQLIMEPEVKTWTEKRRPLTEAVWSQHLIGEVGLGIVPIDEDGSCHWGAIDYDTKVTRAQFPDADDQELVKRSQCDLYALNTKVQLAGLPLIVCRSKSGGAHLYVFFSEPIDAQPLRQQLLTWAKAVGIDRPPPPKRGVTELFPKQVILDASSSGSYLNLPYFRAHTTDRYALGTDGKKLDLAEFLDLAYSKRMTSNQFKVFSPIRNSSMHPESPPCLQALDVLGYPEGSRNNGAFNLGLLFERVYGARWAVELETYIKARFNPPLKDKEISNLIRSLERDFNLMVRRYSYKCKENPIIDHCDRDTCDKRKFGISSFSTQVDVDIEKLEKILTDPPKWRLYMRDGQFAEMDTDDLMEVRKFRRVMLERFNMVFPTMPLDRWDQFLSNLLRNLIEIKAPDDAGVAGQFNTYLMSFLSRRSKVDPESNDEMRWSPVLRGQPLEYDGLVYFLPSDLHRFLNERCRFNDYSRSEMYTAIVNLGGGYSDPKTIGGQRVVLWTLKVPESEQVRSLGIEDIPGDAF